MPAQSFQDEVADKLNWYVYRLLDPRNGETFYVGKGRGDRIFQHATGEITDTEEEGPVDLKLQRIKEITSAGLEVGHVVHRHGITQQWVAYEVEAALIDAYPGLTNKVRGIGSRDRGSRHVEELIREYAAVDFEVEEPLMMISIGVLYYSEHLDIYQAVQCAWKVNVDRARRYNLVLARLRGLVVGAFRPNQPWIPATRKNFPQLSEDMPGRKGFVGEEAKPEFQALYVGKRVPDRYRLKGAQGAVRYCDPDLSP